MRVLTEKDFPFLPNMHTLGRDRAYAYRFLQKRGREAQVVEKFTTNFDAAASQVQALKAQGITVLTYSVFV